MNFLSPTSIAIAAGLTIPPLIALYFLKLKRNVRLVPTTLLWKRAVEDLHVNAPFQRLRKSLLLLLQLLLLILGAIALGKPMFETVQIHEDTIIVMIDQSASMAVLEKDGKTRLQIAKEQARQCIDNMGDDARAMVIAFGDRATIASSFDTDKQSLKRKIDAIEQTQSTTALGEAVSLAEAYAQNLIIGGEAFGSDIAPESAAPPATVFIFTDGKIEDADKVTLQKFDAQRIHMTNVGKRGDNIGIMAMEARRNYDTPEILEVTATIQNFGPNDLSVDAVLYVDGNNVDVQTIQLNAAVQPETPDDRNVRTNRSPSIYSTDPEQGSIQVVSFDEIEFADSGVVEVVLQTDDALSEDDRAWTIIEKPDRIRILLVSDSPEGYRPLETALNGMNVELVTMSPVEYETAREEEIADGDRSLFDVVIMNRYTSDRLIQGNYLFFGAAPMIDGVSVEGVVDDEIIFNWDETHPILRHVAVETLNVYEWLRLKLPNEAEVLIEGASSPVLIYLARDASQYLICSFGLIVEDDEGMMRINTYWPASVDFIVFVQNAISYLSSNVATGGRQSVSPGQPITLPVPQGTKKVQIHRPDDVKDEVTATQHQTIHYARTRKVGVYRIEPGIEGRDQFAVNLFNQNESNVAPASSLTLGAQYLETQAGAIDVNQPAWPYVLIAMLVLLILEWIVYNQRVFV